MNSFYSLESVWEHAAVQTSKFGTRHPKFLASIVAATLVSFGAGALGIAPKIPDPASLPTRVITQQLKPRIDDQLEDLSNLDLKLYYSDITHAGDTADTLLARLHVTEPGAAQFFQTNPLTRKLLDGNGGKMIQARVDDTGHLEQLIAKYAAGDEHTPTKFTKLTVDRVDRKLISSVEILPLESSPVLSSGVISTGLFEATDQARIPDAVASQIAEIFSNDVDFSQDIAPGTKFSVVYETLLADGEPITWASSVGRILAAQFDKSSALWFKDLDSTKGSYFNFGGESKQRSFLASPLNYSRVTSGFAMRIHPILGIWKQHNGIDYAAPIGTPVRAVGDGVVEFAGWENGYGNVIHIRHSNERSTVYAHLSKIEVEQGATVEKGETIGLVGMTGWATGPHLHFEVMINGIHYDPLRVAKQSETTVLLPTSRDRFKRQAYQMKQELQIAATLKGTQGKDD